MVPKGGFEPPRGLPTTPSRWRVYQFHHFGNLQTILKSLITRITKRLQRLFYFFGSGIGACGGSTGTVSAGLSFINEEARLEEANASTREVIIKTIAAIVVNLVRNPIAPALPKTV